ncbi:UNVERIFIED_CONTAM: Lipase [Sesamum calycinum]|uniref:Lipase n=1 Tax=Sesamum calycinum TaxID=2727403 RepID=A0AAW2R927_9LAMI
MWYRLRIRLKLTEELKVTVKHKHNQHHHLAKYNHTLARILVQYASAVYLSDLTELFTWTCSRCNGLTKGFVGVATDLNATVIAFRGTQERSIQNWVEDLYWKQLDIDYPGVDGAMYMRCALGNISANAREEGGMAGGPALSLGEQNVQVMTFGQPRIGNAVFASYFNQLVPDTIRVTNGHDIVPHLPPYYHFPQKTYRHFPREVWLYNIGLGSLIYTVEKVCDGSGEDPTCSRSVRGNSISDHLKYYGVEMGCDTPSGCRIVMDPRVVAYARKDLDGNLILSRELSDSILKLNTDRGDQGSSL